MLLKDTNTGTRKFNGQATSGRVTRDLLATEDSTISLSPPVMDVSGTLSGTETQYDAVLNVYESAEILTTTDVIVSVPLIGYATGPAAYSSSNPSVATIDQSGNVTPVSAGTTVITVAIPGLNSRQVILNVTEQPDGMGTQFSNFVSGSLGAHFASQITGLIDGQSPPSDLPHVTPPPAFSLLNIFQQNGDGTYSRNPNLWTTVSKGLDVTCIPLPGPSNGVLVTKRDMIFAAHAGYNPNPQFLDNEGNLTTMTVKGVSSLGDWSTYNGDGADILLATFTEDVPDCITPAQLMPANFRNYLPQPQYGYPAFFTNQDRTLVVGAVVSFDFSTASGSAQRVVQPIVQPTNSFADWWYAVRIGDSGSPAFFVINNQLVLIGNWHYFGASAPIDADNLTYINNILSWLGSPYSVSQVNLSAFPTYP